MHGSILDPKLVPEEWRAEINPWTPDADLARVLILRGAILWSYCHVEQRLLDLIIRCSRIPEYQKISAQPPFRRGARVKYLRKVFATDGPLKRYASLGHAVLDRYDASAAIRNQMAHSHMSVLTGPGPIRFEEVIVQGADISLHWTPYYPGDLERAAVKAARFSKACQRLRDAAFTSDDLRRFVAD